MVMVTDMVMADMDMDMVVTEDMVDMAVMENTVMDKMKKKNKGVSQKMVTIHGPMSVSL
jgi:hypothetical protein